MAVATVIGTYPFKIQVTKTTPITVLVGDKFDIVGGQKIVLLMEVEYAGSDSEGIPAVAVYTANPGIIDTVTTVTGSATDASAKFEHDISTTTTKYTAQAAIAANLDTSSTPGEFRGRLTVILYANERDVGEIDVAVPPGLSSNVSLFYVGRIPSTGLTKLRAALYGSGFTANTVKWELYVRGVNDTTSPSNSFVRATSGGSATAFGTATTPNVCSGDVTVNNVTVDNFAWLDVALALTLDTSSGPTGMLHVKVGGIYS